MSLWTRRSESSHKLSEGQVVHSYLWTLEAVSAGLQRLGVNRNAADRGGLFIAFRLEGYSTREANEVVDRLLPRIAKQPSGELESPEKT